MSKYKDTNLLCDVTSEDIDNTVDNLGSSNTTVTNNTNYGVKNKKSSNIALDIIIDKVYDVKQFCENNRGTCAGLTFVFILIILIAGTGRNCRKRKLSI